VTEHQLDVIIHMKYVTFFSPKGKYNCRQKFVWEINCKLHWKLKCDLSGRDCWENEV